jgi:hypothetical protein
MPFVVRVAGTGFNIAWLGSDPSDGSCVFRVAPRRTCLSDTSGRTDASDKATKAFGRMGMVFSVEVAD